MGAAARRATLLLSMSMLHCARRCSMLQPTVNAKTQKGHSFVFSTEQFW